LSTRLRSHGRLAVTTLLVLSLVMSLMMFFGGALTQQVNADCYDPPACNVDNVCGQYMDDCPQAFRPPANCWWGDQTSGWIGKTYEPWAIPPYHVNMWAIAHGRCDVDVVAIGMGASVLGNAGEWQCNYCKETYAYAHSEYWTPLPGRACHTFTFHSKYGYNATWPGEDLQREYCSA
jgi:hypothetical protein